MGDAVRKTFLCRMKAPVNISMLYGQEAAVIVHNVITIRVFIRKIPTNSALINGVLLGSVSLAGSWESEGK